VGGRRQPRHHLRPRGAARDRFGLSPGDAPPPPVAAGLDTHLLGCGDEAAAVGDLS
jgi:hypothetical protein